MTGTRAEQKLLLGTMILYSPDTRIVSTSYDKSLIMWHATSVDRMLVIKNNSDEISLVDWHPSGTKIASGNHDTLIITDSASGEHIRTFSLDSILNTVSTAGAISCFAWSSDRQNLAIGLKDSISTLCRLRVADYRIRRFTLSNREVHSVCWSPDGFKIASGSRESLIIWNVDSGEALMTLRGHRDSVRSVSYSPDGSRIVSAGGDQMVLWDAVGGDTISRHVTEGIDFHQVKWSPDGSMIASSCLSASRLVLWDAATMLESPRLDRDSGRITCFDWSPCGSLIVTGSAAGLLAIWTTDPASEVVELKGHTKYVQAVAWSRDGERIVSSSKDSTVRIWDAAFGVAQVRLALAMAMALHRRLGCESPLASLGCDVVKMIACRPDVLNLERAWRSSRNYVGR